MDAPRDWLQSEPLIRILVWMLRAILPSHASENIAGDLIEEYREQVLPQRGRLIAQLWATGEVLSWSYRYFLEALRQDLLPGVEFRQALRVVCRAPWFSLAVILMLAAGIGAATTVFSVVSRVLLRPLPYPNSDRLAMVWERRLDSAARGPQGPVSPANFSDWRDQSRAFQSLAAVRNAPAVLADSNGAVRLKGSRISSDLLTVLGVQPMIGRPFFSADDEPGARPTVILSFGLWQRRFRADVGILGKPIRLNDQQYSVVGVMPPGFEFPPPIAIKGITPMEPSDLWMPLRLGKAGLSRDASILRVFGLLLPGLSVSKAETEMEALSVKLAREYPATNSAVRSRVVLLEQQVVANIATPLWFLLGAAGLLVTVICVNTGNLFLARSFSRHREIAIRYALGAGRLRLAGQMLMESSILSVLSGIVGLAIAFGCLRVLPLWLPPNFPRSAEIGMDFRAVTLAGLMSVGCGLFCGAFPAFVALRSKASQGFREAGRSNAGSQRESTLGRGLMVAQFAAAALLMVCSGLLLKSFARLQRVDPGFKADHLLSMRLSLPPAAYGTRERVATLHREILRRVQQLPGIKTATVSMFLPFGNSQLGVNLDIENMHLRPNEHKPTASYQVIGPSHFETMGIPLLEGRSFRWNDDPSTARVAIVSAAMARQLWPDQDPIGRRVRLGDPDEDPSWMAIVGVAGDIRQYGLDADTRPTLYLPALQVIQPNIYLVSRTLIAPERLAGIVANEVASVDKAIAVSDVGTVEAKIRTSLEQRQLVTTLVAAFSLATLLLAAFGIYAVLTHIVSRKTAEIGVRIALGASRGTILRQILVLGCAPACAGAGLGLTLALVAGKILASFLFETRFYDLPVVLGSSIALVSIGALAALVPAWRAMKADPITALRTEG